MLPSANLVGQGTEDLCLDVVPVLVEGEGAGASVVGQPLLRAPHLQDVAQVGSQNLEPDIFQMCLVIFYFQTYPQSINNAFKKKRFLAFQLVTRCQNLNVDTFQEINMKAHKYCCHVKIEDLFIKFYEIDPPST